MMRSSRRAYSAVAADSFRTWAVVAMESSGLLGSWLIGPEDQIGFEVADLGTAAEAHRDVHLIAQDLEDAGDALGAVGRETPERRAAQHDDLGAAGQAFDHAGALRKPAVDHDLGAPGHRVDDGRQCLDGRLRVI